MMLSRVAENLFWIGRNVERAQGLCRLLDATYQVQLGAVPRRIQDKPAGAKLAPVLHILGLPEETLPRPGRLMHELMTMTFGQSSDHTVTMLLNQAKENARASQDVLGAEPFSQLNRLHHALGSKRFRSRFRESPSRVLNQVSQGGLLFFALVSDGQPRAAPWYFLDLGRRLESVGMLCRLLFEALCVMREGTSAYESAHWSWLLGACAARDTFMSRYPEGVTPEYLIDLLVLDEQFPHSIRYGVSHARSALEGIGSEAGSEVSRDAERLIGRLDALLSFAESAEILDEGVENILGEIQWTCDRVSDRLYAAYF
ncbi:hypothetical protein GC170_19265 [bacterium]|nr:hypothetical protein [bacterium]